MAIINNLVDQSGVNQINPSVPTAHDNRVILFQVIVFGIQAALIHLGTYNFGANTPYVLAAVQIISEYLRRIVV